MGTGNGVAGRTIFCRYSDCAEAYIVVMGRFPTICPACNRPAQWTTLAPLKITPNYADPAKSYELTPKDAAMLRALKIDPEVA